MQNVAYLPRHRTRRPATASLADVAPERLLALVGERHEAALAELYDRYGTLAYSLALRVLRDRNFAEDAVQEAFVAVWRTASRFDAERGSARAWILTLVHRRAVDRVRREQRHHDAGAETLPELAVEDADSLEQMRVRKALKRLAADERRVVALAYYEGLTQEEIANALGVPVGTVKSRTARALGRLASFLDDAGDSRRGDERHG